MSSFGENCVFEENALTYSRKLMEKHGVPRRLRRGTAP